MTPENPQGIQSTTHELIEHIKGYINTRIDIIKLQAIDKGSAAAGSIVLYFLLFFFGVLMLILASIGLALWLNQLLESGFSGFFIVAGVYLLLAVIVFAGREKFVKKNISNMIIRQLLND